MEHDPYVYQDRTPDPQRETLQQLATQCKVLPRGAHSALHLGRHESAGALLQALGAHGQRLLQAQVPLRGIDHRQFNADDVLIVAAEEAPREATDAEVAFLRQCDPPDQAGTLWLPDGIRAEFTAQVPETQP